MKTSIPSRLNRIFSFAVVVATAAICLSATSARAVNFVGNGNTSFGGDIGNGTLTLTDNGTNLNGTLILGNGNHMYNTLVIYIDTGAGGGFSDTSTFNDQNDALRIGISGVQDGQGRSVMTFTNGFAPQYAIAIGPNTGSFGGLWQLASGNNNSLIFKQSANLNPNSGNTGPFTFSIQATNLGLTAGSQTTFKIFGTYISGSGYRSAEAVAGNDSGSAGWHPFTQTAFANYTFGAPAPVSHPVGFQVDMTEQIALGKFVPGNGDTVEAAGTFQTNVWTGFLLNPSVGNANIYVGTYQDFNPTNTAEQFKFFYNSVSGASQNYEGVDNRPFTITAAGVTNPLVYFDDVYTNVSATTNYLKFTIDMTPQIGLGHFDPASGDTIQVLGTLISPKWTTGVFILTNNPSLSGNASNIYSGTIADGNYPGSSENYKFVIVSTGGNTYENGNNRQFLTPAGSFSFPTAFFNNIISAYSIPVTFQVDMTIPVLLGLVNPANGDTVSAAGTFQTNQWTPNFFLLTNNPTAANSNVFSGTYIDRNPPGSFEDYKFQYTQNGNTTWEGIANREFVLGSTGTNLPVVLWNNQNTNTVLLSSTVVTFTVDMKNAVDIFGNPFDPANDIVMVDGDFDHPQWQLFNNAQDLFISTDYPNSVMANNPPGSTLYTVQFTLPAGNSIQTYYKYGIYHNTSSFNTNVDNEAGFAQNHSRYIRSGTGSYTFPTDIFGQQIANPSAANEPLFGKLALGAITGGQLPITWLGGVQNVHLQTTTNLISNWQDVSSTTGVNSTNWPTDKGNRYFRLVKP